MTSDRFASIGDLLPNRPAAVRPLTPRTSPTTTTLKDAPGRDVVGPKPASRTVPANSSGARTATPRRPRASEVSSGGTRRVAFRLDPELHRRLVDRATRERTSNGNVVLDAIQSAHDANTLVPRPTQPELRGMFIRTPIRNNPTPSVLVEIRLHTQALSEVDRLVTETRAGTRTQLFQSALAHYLTEPDSTSNGEE
jgi:hypothetical protein